MAQEGVEPSASLVLSESGLPVAYRAGRGLNPAATTQGGIRTHRRPGLSRAARPVGVPGRVAAEAVGLEPTSGPRPPPVFRTGPSSGRMASVRTLGPSSGGWNRTSGLRVQGAASRPPATAPEFGKEDSNPHRLIQSQGACQLADSRERPAGVEPACPAWEADAWAARPRALGSAEGEG